MAARRKTYTPSATSMRRPICGVGRRSLLVPGSFPKALSCTMTGLRGAKASRLGRTSHITPSGRAVPMTSSLSVPPMTVESFCAPTGPAGAPCRARRPDRCWMYGVLPVLTYTPWGLELFCTTTGRAGPRIWQVLTASRACGRAHQRRCSPLETAGPYSTVRQFWPPAGGPRLPMHTVLLVDDEKPIRSVLRKLFERGGLTVREAESGREALDTLADDP